MKIQPKLLRAPFSILYRSLYRKDGGSLRLFVEPHEATQDSVRLLVKQEVKWLVDCVDYYLQFGDRVQEIKQSLMEILWDLKRQGKRIVGYGAAAKRAFEKFLRA